MAARAAGLVGSKPEGEALSGLDLIEFDLDAKRLQRVGEIGILEKHADRADDRGVMGDDVVAAERRDIGAGGGQPIDHHHHRLLGLQGAQGVVKLLRAGGGAAGAVDVHDDGLGARLGQPRERLDPLAVVADEAGDLDAGDVAGFRQQAVARHQQQGEAAHGQEDDQRGENAPEGQFAPQPAAIDDGIGIERHGVRSFVSRSFRGASHKRVYARL